MDEELAARKARHLYVFGDGASVFKIGRSFNPLKRQPEHRKWYRQHFGTERTLDLLHVEHDAGWIESYIHSHLSEYLIAGEGPNREWFNLADVDKPLELVLAKIAEVKSTYGLPDRPPSDSLYTYGCRCPGCRAAHTGAVRERRERELVTGTLADRRKTRGLIHDLVEMADRYPELHMVLHRYGHAPPVIRVQPESVADAPIVTEPAASSPEPVVPAPKALPAGNGEGQDTEAVTEPLSHADELLKLAISHADKNGHLPPWLVSATSIAGELGISAMDAQAALHALWGEDMTMGAHGGPKLIRRVG
jgi:hypothetical protein